MFETGDYLLIFLAVLVYLNTKSHFTNLKCDLKKSIVFTLYIDLFFIHVAFYYVIKVL